MKMKMRIIVAAILSVTLGSTASAETGPGKSGTVAANGAVTPAMVVSRAGTQASSQGPEQYFTGTVRIDPLFGMHPPSSSTTSAAVTFEPGARSAWHTHPAGQILIVTSGVGRVQQWGRQVQEIRPGDVIWTPPGVKHWHGAAPTTAMTHLSIFDSVNGKNADWMEKVSDEQYGK